MAGGEALAGAQQEGHSRPAIVVHPHPGGNVGLGARVVRNALNVRVPLVLPHHDVGRGQGSETADDTLSCLGQALGFEAVWRLHRHLAGELEQVGHQHVQNGSGGLVEGGPHGHIERFGHIDLHALYVGVVPGTGEQAVGESQDMDVLRCFLPEKVVDPIDL